MDVSFDSVDSVYEPFDSTYDLPGLQYEPTNRECDLTEYDPYVSTASICEQTEAFDSVDSVYQSMEPTYGLTGLQCEPTSFSPTPTDSEHDLKDFHPHAPTEEPFEQTEGKAWRLLAARIPQELFDDILFYVNVDCVSQRGKFYLDGAPLRRNQGKPSRRDILADLKRCSLVCLFWANRCREHICLGRTLQIESYEDAQIFRRYILQGCARLTPVHQLIMHIEVTQKYSGVWVSQDHRRQTSFLHLLYIPAIQDKLVYVSIYGPVSDDFNPAKLDTPHWGVPLCIVQVVPSSFLLSDISLRNIHFPSFRHVTKYIRHFSCATYIAFDTITWDGQTPTATYSLPQASNKINCQRRPRCLISRVYEGCTDPVYLALTALMLNPNCPLHRLSDGERRWMIGFMTLLWGDEPDRYPITDPGVEIGFNVSEQTTTMRLWPFGFVFDGAPLTDRPASALSLVGMCAYIYSMSALLAHFDALVNHARTHPTIRALVLLFESLDRLQESVKPFLEVLTLATGTIELVLAYEEWKERRAVGVDLATLEPNGRIWADLPESKRYEGHLKSSHILQTQLKKKMRGSVH